MKTISQYLPFFIISCLLHALLLFVHPRNKVIVQKTPFASAQQSIKVQLLTMQVTTPPPLKKQKKESAQTTEHTQANASMSIKAQKASKIKKQIIQKKRAPSTKPKKERVENIPQRIPKPTLKKKAINTLKKSESALSTKPQGTLQKATVISGKRPTYPRRARLRSQQGRVKVHFIVDTQGIAHQAKIIKSSGHNILDKAVLNFIQTERFMVALAGDKKVSSEQVFTFRFELK
ncbi:hypothetical protein JI57_00285 [Psychromonas sp. PRT-SC03]|nr:hypothetical protein JI57_00285 [Psychromonas sp. PRT-SC03]